VSIAVLAVDPSSQVSGGALLGDRTRLRVRPDERRLFFRSQASDSDLGGLGPTTFQVCRLLTRLFDCVMIETVGIGQSEGDIRQLADRVYLVLQPLGGDEVQFLKAGIIEVPDAFILNKCDEPAAMTSFHQLRGSMWLARPFDEEEPPIFLTSARTGDGLDELEADLFARIQGSGSTGLAAREPYFFERWVSDEWGRVGRVHLDGERGGAAAYLAAHGGFDASQSSFGPDLVDSLR
jgi:LAO/AO transport system kinase